MDVGKEPQQWRWLLVDSLAHGRKWYNPLHASALDTPEYHELQKQFEEENNLRTKLAIVKLMHKICGDNLLNMYCQFSLAEAAEILTTPRFDISDSFRKADIPNSQDEYFPKLPALAIPFPKFWVEWKWIDDKGEAHFCCQVVAHDPCEDGSIRLSLTGFTWLPTNSSTVENACLKDIATARLSADRKIESLDYDGDKKTEGMLLYPCIHAMALLGCKNVTTQEMRAPRPLRRSTERTFGVALCSYHVVTILHGKRGTRTMAGGSQGTSRALSICRGHFKTYDDHGLFGNKKGTWWWQDHVRGDYEKGVVVKDYALTANVEDGRG